jgi:hypothetical protein
MGAEAKAQNGPPAAPGAGGAARTPALSYGQREQVCAAALEARRAADWARRAALERVYWPRALAVGAATPPTPGARHRRRYANPSPRSLSET